MALRMVTTRLLDRQLAALRSIQETTGIPVAFLVRQGVDRILAEHGVTVPKPAGRSRR